MSGTYHLLIGRLEQPILAASDRESKMLLLPNGINGVAPELAPKKIKKRKTKINFYYQGENIPCGNMDFNGDLMRYRNLSS